MVRVLRDGFADIVDIETGSMLHQFVRYALNSDGMVAVFTSPTSGPVATYPSGDVTLTQRQATCSHPVCRGKVSRHGLQALWSNTEAAC